MKSTAFDTKSDGNYRKPIRNHQEIVVKLVAFDKKSISQYEIIANYKKTYEINRKSS